MLTAEVGGSSVRPGIIEPAEITERDVLVFVQPSTVIAWQRRRFRDHWARLAHGRPGRPALDKSVQELIRKMSSANPRWGSPRIAGELAEGGGLYQHYERRAA